MFCLLFIVLNVLGLILIGVVTTSSMEPVSPLGSLTLFVKQGSYSVGDIIAFNVQGCLVMHRIVQIAPNAIYTKGDKNSDIDPWILPENAIYGRLVISIPLLGYLFTFLRAPMMIAAVGTAIFIMVTWKYFGRKTTEEPEPPLPKA
jgi:signal peptidase